MKKFLMLWLFVISSNLLFGQSLIGVFSGYDICKLKFKGVNEYDYGKSFNTFCAGIDYKTKSSKLIHMGYSLNYITKSLYLNSTSNHMGGGWNVSARYHLHYVSFELFPEISFGKTLKYYLNAGPSLTVLVNSKKDGILSLYSMIPGYNSTTVESGSANKDFSKIILGARGSVGISYPLSEKISIYIESRYLLDLTDLGFSYTGDYCDGIITKNLYFLGGFHYALK